MAEKTQEKKKTQKTTGKRKGRIAAHFTRAPMKKLRHVLKTSGLEAGKAYLKARGMIISSAALKLIAEPRWERHEAAKRARAITRRERYAARRAKRDHGLIMAARARDEGIETGESLSAI